MSEVPLYPTCTLLVTTMDKFHLVRLFRVGKLAAQGRRRVAVLQDTISIAVADFGLFAEGKLFGGYM